MNYKVLHASCLKVFIFHGDIGVNWRYIRVKIIRDNFKIYLIHVGEI